MTTKVKIFKYESNIKERQIEASVNEFIANLDVINVSTLTRPGSGYGDIFITVTYRD